MKDHIFLINILKFDGPNRYDYGEIDEITSNYRERWLTTNIVCVVLNGHISRHLVRLKYEPLQLCNSNFGIRLFYG